MAKKGPKIEYTPEQEAARDELIQRLVGIDVVAHRAGLRSFKYKIVWGKGGSIESEYRREWDKHPTPYGVPVEKPAVQPLAMPTK